MAGKLFLAGCDLLALAAAVGCVLAVGRRDVRVVVPLCVAASVVLPHAITWMDLMYYYVKLPFLVLFGFYGLDRALALPARAARALAVGAVVAILGLALAATLSAVVFTR